MKITESIYMVAICAVMMLTSCTDDLLTEDIKKQDFDEGELTEIAISLNVSSLSIDSKASRAEDPALYDVDDSDSEKRINNFWIFQFNSAGNKLINPRYYTVESQDELKNFKVLLKAGEPSKICIVTNTSDPEWIERAGNFDQFESLKKQTIFNSSPRFRESLNDPIPMWGVKETTVVLDQTEEILVERMFARLDLKIKFVPTTLTLSDIEINNISTSCQVSTRYIDDNTVGSYPSEDYCWITRTWPLSAIPTTSEGYDYVSIYVPENIQGVVSLPGAEGTAAEKLANAPDHALRVNFHVVYTEKDTGAESEYTYTVYPGGNYYDNYNIRRNCIYQVTVDVEHDDDAAHTPSSNCIVVTPGKLAMFEPYYRVETGGNYNFKDYLDEDDPTGKKVIKSVKILWQTTDVVDSGWRKFWSPSYEISGLADRTVIGDNSDGTKVWFSTDKTYKRIYVRTRKKGNALIGAYNKFGELIWSWHIWSTDLGPQKVGNAVVYTTFDWDNSGTHYKSSRIPGYAVMSCNLGALADNPTDDSDNWSQTWGMLYQWGRKDPFPPVYVPFGDINWGLEDSPVSVDGRAPARTHSYDDKHVTALFNNSNERITNISESEQQSPEQLFYTYSVWKNLGTMVEADDGINYSISHPTVFMCGDDQPGVFDTNDGANGEDCNKETGDWLPKPANLLWGGLETNSATKELRVSDYNTIYNNYGSDKTIFDPCPTGWRVPPDNLWMSFTFTGLNPDRLYPTNSASVSIIAKDVNFDTQKNIPTLENNQGPGVWMYMQNWKSGPELFFPTQGIRRPRGQISRVYMCGSYLSANVGMKIKESSISGGNWVNCLHMHYPEASCYSPIYFMVFEYANSIFRSKSTAGSVRCVRDTY